MTQPEAEELKEYWRVRAVDYAIQNWPDDKQDDMAVVAKDVFDYLWANGIRPRAPSELETVGDVAEIYRQGKEAINYLFRELQFCVDTKETPAGYQLAHGEALDCLNRLGMLAHPTPTQAVKGEPIGYVHAPFITERREEYELNGTVMYHQPMGTYQMPVYAHPAPLETPVENEALEALKAHHEWMIANSQPVPDSSYTEYEMSQLYDQTVLGISQLERALSRKPLDLSDIDRKVDIEHAEKQLTEFDALYDPRDNALFWSISFYAHHYIHLLRRVNAAQNHINGGE